jgi:hypothetical protein
MGQNGANVKVIAIKEIRIVSVNVQKKKVVGLEWGPLSLVSTTEELLRRKSSGFCLENRDYGRRGSVMLTTWHPLSARIGTIFADKRRSLGWYSLLAGSDHGVGLFCLSVNVHFVPEGQVILPSSAYCYSALLTLRFYIYKSFFEFLNTFSCATFSKNFILFCSIT